VTGGTPGTTGTAGDSEAVTQLVLRERQTRDRGWYDEMAECFVPDATIVMSWFTGSASDFIATTRARTVGGVWGRHRLSPPTVRVKGDRAWAELPLGIEFAIDIDGIAADLVSYCRSQYRAARTQQGWKIVGITSIYERDTITPAIPGQSLDVDPAAFSSFRPSYRCLAWYFDKAGTPLPGDLLGDDQPGPVAEQYQQEQLWLTSAELGIR
jgi:hypothetical protein